MRLRFLQNSELKIQNYLSLCTIAVVLFLHNVKIYASKDSCRHKNSYICAILERKRYICRNKQVSKITKICHNTLNCE